MAELKLDRDELGVLSEALHELLEVTGNGRDFERVKRLLRRVNTKLDELQETAQ